MKLCPKCQKHFSDDANFCPVDAARLVPLDNQANQATSQADSLTTRFELKEQLAGNRTGAVHRAVDKTTGKPCVVKLVAKSVVALPGVAQRLERELKQLERVQSVGVCHVIASGKRGEETWIATELFDGAQTLAEAISARGPIPAEAAANLVEVIGEALIEAAQVGVVHRDLAPKNVLFAGQDVKLINFSLPVPTTDKVPGVPEFVAPEQVEGRPVDQRSNLYSLGALYYYVLTGQLLFEGAPEAVHKQHQSGTIKPPSQVVGDVPAPVEAVIMRALDRSPTKRFLTVRQFVDEVMRVGHGEVIELKATMAMGKAGRPKGELVQTLMGIHKGGALPVSAKPSPATKLDTVVGTAAAPAAAAPVAAAPAEKRPGGIQVQTSPAGPMAMTALTPPPSEPVAAAPAPAAEKPAASPWAAPATQPAAPVVAAPVVAAPVIAAPVVAAAPAGKKKADDDRDKKGKFRETMWFKKGELDAQAAEVAAAEAARTGKAADSDKADSLPMDERYKDDGSITRSDKEKYSLRTGATQTLPSLRDKKETKGPKVSEESLIGEMKGGRGKIIAAIVLGMAVLVAVVYWFAHS